MNKEQLKKLFLGGIGLVVLIYVYFSFFIGPLNKSRADVQAKITAVQGKLDSSKNELTKTGRLEENARAAIARNTALRSLSPDGAPIAWFPPRVRAFFAAQQIDKASVRLESSSTPREKELEKWTRYIWAIDIPQADFETLGRALAALENSEPLLFLTRLRIQAGGKGETELQQVSLTASTLIEKK